MNNIMVSACIITYNQESYIRECIEGVVSQDVNFDYEIIIGEDFSTDNTNQICEEYAQRYPDLIKYFPRKKNLGMMGNWIATIKDCKGKYIALCEGDDYWTDPLKLQKQVDFLEANDDYNMCFHRIEIFEQEENRLRKDTITRDVPETTDIEELTKGNFIHTPSVVFRNNFTIPKWFSKSPIGDWTLYMIAIKDKKIKKLDDVMAVYRVHSDSIWSLKTNEFRILKTLESFNLVLKSSKITDNIKNILKETIKKYKNQLPQKPYLFIRILKKVKNYLNV